MNKKFFILTLMLSSALSTFAVEEIIDGLLYDISPETKEAKVIKYKGDSKYTGEIRIPESVEYEGMKHNVTRIDSYAFFNCSELTSVSIPSGLISIGDMAFDGCSGLTAVHISDLEAWCKINFGFVANPLPYAHHLFLNGEEIKDLEIPQSMTSIDSYTFAGCSGLTSVKIPNNVIYIWEGAFSGCSGLTSINIPNSVTTIAAFAFQDCSNLTSVSIPASVTLIGSSAFEGCNSLSSVHISDLEAWCKINFLGEFSNPISYANHLFLNGEEIKDLEIPQSITSIGNYTFAGCSGLIAITIPSSVKSIGGYALAGCSGLTNVSIPSSVETIDYFAFYKCNNLTSITIPNSVTAIGWYAFADCSELTSVVMSDGLTRIAEHLFDGCIKLTTVKIPSSITLIEKNAFAGCSGLTDFYCLAEDIPLTPDNIFQNTSIEYATLHVPAGSIDAYKAAEPWNHFKEIIALEDDDPSTSIQKNVKSIYSTKYYTIDGNYSAQPRKGLNIIRTDNGTTRKILLK